jgi:hypothetical protein
LLGGVFELVLKDVDFVEEEDLYWLALMLLIHRGGLVACGDGI